MEPSIFAKIIHGDVPGVRIWEDERVIVLMDKFPAVEGQILVIPKELIDYIFDIPDELYSHLWLVAKKMAKALDLALKPRRVCIIVEGFEVPHAHIRMYPVPNGVPLVTKPGGMADDAYLEVIAKKIRKELS
jgi:histidine triad (HIT) family protein